MALYTDLIDPATLTGYARASLAEYEAKRGTLARWLPNRFIEDVVARFLAGETGLVDIAKFRAYDAEPEMGKRPQGKRVTIELPALGQNIPVTEYEQLRARSGSVTDEQALKTVLATTRTVVQSVADAIEYMRGVVLTTGKATITQDNYISDDDFARPAGHTVVAPALWSVPGTDGLGQLEGWTDVYRTSTGGDPGAILMSTRALRAFGSLTQNATQLANGGSRRATRAEVQAIVEGAGLPPIYLYDRRVSVSGVSTKVIPDDRVMLLPEPVDPDDWMGTELGSTIWGRTLTASDPNWEIEEGEQAGIVAGVYKNPKPPMGLEVISDAIGLPVLANGQLSLVADVL